MSLFRAKKTPAVHFTAHKRVTANRPADEISPGLNTTAPLTGKGRLLIISTVLGCIAGVLAISWFFLIHNSLRLDESQSIWQTSHSLAGTLHTIALDVHVPLYHVMLHFWLFYFGDSVVSVRTMSLIFFIATIPVIYLLARELLSRRWSLVVLVLFSFSPFLLWYANEARMYTLLLFMSALNQLFFLRAMRTGKGWLAYTVSAAIGAYSHYFFMFNLAAQALYYLINYKDFRKGTFKKLVGAGLAVVVAIGPWLYYVRSLGSASDTRPNLPVPSTVDFFNVYSQFIFGFQSDYINTFILSAWPLVMLLALIAIRRSSGVRPQIKFMLAMAALPVLLAYVVSLAITPFFLSRYMVLAVPPLIISIVYLASHYRQRFALLTLSLLLALTAVSSYLQIQSNQTPVKEDYQAVARDINAAVKPQDVVIVSAPFTVYPFEYYYRGSAQIRTLPQWNRSEPGSIPGFNKATLPQQVDSLHKNHRYVYLLQSQDQGYEKTISDYYLNHFKQISHKTYSPGMTLYVYQVGFYTVPELGTGNTTAPIPSATPVTTTPAAVSSTVTVTRR